MFVFNPITGNLDVASSGGSGPTPSFPANYKDSVLTAAALPVGSDGDVRVVLDEATVYVYSGALAKWVPQHAPKDVPTTTEPILNNQSTPVEITSFKLNNQVSSFEATVEVRLTTLSATIERCLQHLYCTYDGAEWVVVSTLTGADVLDATFTVQFDIGGNPTVYYTTENRPDFASAQIKFRANSL